MYIVAATVLFIIGVAALTAIMTIIMTRGVREEHGLTAFEHKKMLKGNLLINCPAAALVAVAICCFSFIGPNENIAFASPEKKLYARTFDWHQPELTPEVRKIEAEVKKKYEKAVQSKKHSIRSERKRVNEK